MPDPTPMTREEVEALAAAVDVIVTHADRHDRITLTRAAAALRQLYDALALEQSLCKEMEENADRREDELAALRERKPRWGCCACQFDENDEQVKWCGPHSEMRDQLAALREERGREEWQGYINGITFMMNQRPPSSRTHDGANTLNELREIGSEAARLAEAKGEGK